MGYWQEEYLSNEEKTNWNNKEFLLKKKAKFKKTIDNQIFGLNRGCIWGEAIYSSLRVINQYEDLVNIINGRLKELEEIINV